MNQREPSLTLSAPARLPALHRSHQQGEVHLQLLQAAGWSCDVKTDRTCSQFASWPEETPSLWADFYIHHEVHRRAMEEALNITIHPACLQEPPLAMHVIRRKWPTSRWLIVFPYQAARNNNGWVSRVPAQSLPAPSVFWDVVSFWAIPITTTLLLNMYVETQHCVSPCPSRDGCVQFQPVHHAQLHVLHIPAALPGAVRLHLQEKLLPQEDHHHLDQRRSTSKKPHPLIYVWMFICGFFFSLLV